ncbi:MAG: hypothetical protein HDP28_01220 [Clostridia bacterium]|nr:hypothetical protein [Clostridia bacterium]
MKKILILTVTAGNAHNACALGMKRELERSGNAQVKIVDLLKSCSTKLNAWIAESGYCLAVSKFPKLYNAFYRRYRKADPNKRYSCPAQGTALSTVNDLLQEILNFQPDVVYCTHFYGAIALTDLKLVYSLPCKVIATSLDYVNSPFWEAGIGVDYLTLPNEDFIDTYLNLGYAREQLLPCGIPVDTRTLLPADKAAARKILGLGENLFTVAVMFGGGSWSGGYKIFKRLVKALKGRSAQIVMINGKDVKSFKRVQKMKPADGIKVLNVGFTENVPLYLSAADVAVNKCGGGCSTENLNLALPMLITEKLAAQEKYNLDYLKQRGAALSFKNKRELKAQIIRLMEDFELRSKMSRCALSLRTNGAAELAAFMLSQPSADYSEFLYSHIGYEDHLNVKKAVRDALKKADKGERRRTKGK